MGLGPEGSVEPGPEGFVEPGPEGFVGSGPEDCVVWLEVGGSGGSIGSQFLLSLLSTISSRVALVNLSVPLEDNPPALGVQRFTVCHSSVTVTLPV